MGLWRNTAGSISFLLTAINEFIQAFATLGHITNVVLEELELETEINSRANIAELITSRNVSDDDVKDLREKRAKRIASRA